MLCQNQSQAADPTGLISVCGEEVRHIPLCLWRRAELFTLHQRSKTPGSQQYLNCSALKFPFLVLLKVFLIHFFPYFVGLTKAAHSVMATLPRSCECLKGSWRSGRGSASLSHPLSGICWSPLLPPCLWRGVSSEGCCCSENPSGTNPERPTAALTSKENVVLYFHFLNCGVLF